MADNSSIFPPKDADFNQYLVNAVPRLVSEATRLGISAGNVTELGTRKTAWDTTYGLAKNKATATTVIKQEKANQRKSFESFLRDLYNDIPNSALNETDRNILNLTERDAKTPRGKISDRPIVGIAHVGGGDLQFKVRNGEDSSRPSMHNLADVIEVVYKLVDPKLDPDGRLAPHSPADCTHREISTKSTFVLSLGIEHAGHIIYAYVRWGNASNRNNSGPYTDMLQKIIV